MSRPNQYLYLHGFMSSPESSKARFLVEQLSQYQLTLKCPDLNGPDFSTLTVSRMISQVKKVVLKNQTEPVTLFGSSLGALVALHLAELVPDVSGLQVDRLILLAPALKFGANRSWLNDQVVESWREQGWLEVSHHAYGERRRLHYEMFLDAGRYDSFNVTNVIPTLIIQGSHDDVIDPEEVERFASTRPNVKLVMVDDGHQLQNSLDQLWSEVQNFLELEVQES